MAERELSPQGYIITKDPVNVNPFWEQEGSNPSAQLPSGGTTGQVLTKKSANNFDVEWKDIPPYITEEELNAATEEWGESLQAEREQRTQDIDYLAQQIAGLNIPNVAPIVEAVQTLSQNLQEEATAREQADTALGERIDNLNIPNVEALTQRVSEIGTEQEQIKQTVNGLGEDITNEATAREQADTALGERIDDEATAREQADTALGERIDNVRQLPEGGTAGQVVTKDENGVPVWSDPAGGESGEPYVLPQATENVLGGVKAKEKTTESVEVAIDSNTGKLYVPEQSGGGGGGSYVLPQATENALGGVKAKAKTTETVEVAIDTDTGKLYVPEQSGGGSAGGGIGNGTLVALFGSETPALTGGSSFTSDTEIPLVGDTTTSALQNVLATYKYFRVDILSAGTSYGFHTFVVGNPNALHGVPAAQPQYFKAEMPYIQSLLQLYVKSNATYQQAFHLKSVKYSDAITAVALTSITGVAIYGLN